MLSRLRSLIHAALSAANRRLDVVETDPEANAYYAWADARLDQLAAEARRLKGGRS